MHFIRKKTKNMSGKNNNMYGKRYITDGKNNRVIPKGETPPKGWRFGMIKKKQK